MKRKIRKSGSSILVAINKAMLETLGLKVGDFAEVKAVKEGQILITKVKEDR